jgi:hypothetical protein
LGDRAAQVRACANLATTYEALKDYEKAKSYQEQNLNIATLVNDRVAKIKALGNLGKTIDRSTARCKEKEKELHKIYRLE